MKNEQHHVKQVIIDPTAIGLFGLAMVYFSSLISKIRLDRKRKWRVAMGNFLRRNCSVDCF